VCDLIGPGIERASGLQGLMFGGRGVGHMCKVLYAELSTTAGGVSTSIYR
jgi:hypothetical protein